MELGTHIKQYRKELGISQDELAERIFVSRQSISNWENNKTYPDIHTLLLLSDVFSVSLDELIKGDVEEMKQEIVEQERAGFQRDSVLFAISLAATVLAAVPLFLFVDTWGIIIWAFILGICAYYCGRVELYKKMYDIQTYKEILAFDQGASLDDLAVIRTQRPKRRWPGRIIMALAAALIGAACTFGGMALFDWLGLF